MGLDFQKNLGDTDRAVRMVVGGFLLGLAASQTIAGPWAVVAAVFGASQIIEGYYGY
ncbi:YgaP family membrane protein [Sporolituus thermophilus]|uniref:Inner membrane protein YgaP-like transmembrane domain-containing protein n=1 Tax=Sporolituus thermophilus DSM 23256 TaxID=1123285 RepID=A0A1G7IPG1_9FIRM|nr:DUF2892 domain-containing protein [Sporolituus thermophilus]SDF14468.1 Protein of unknown function [Sporolituus thermophilus DSM 23256]